MLEGDHDMFWNVHFNAEEMLKNAAKKQWFYVNSAHRTRVLSSELVQYGLNDASLEILF